LYKIRTAKTFFKLRTNKEIQKLNTVSKQKYIGAGTLRIYLISWCYID